jgi:hypothetical protein
MALIFKYPHLKVDMFRFLDTHVKQASSPWRDRRSRLNR